MATSSITANFYTDDPKAANNIVRALFTNVQPSRGLPASLMPCEFKTPAAKRAFIMKAVRRARECQPAAAAAGQAKVIKKIVLGPGRYDGTWAIGFDLDEEKMPEGRKIADTLAAFATGENGLASLAGATGVLSVTIPKEAATSGLYYSLLVSSDLGFSDPAETAHALADGQNDLSFLVAPAKDPAAPRFFKVKVSLQKE